MERKQAKATDEHQPQYDGGDLVSLEEDPAQFVPTGGTGLMNPRNDPERGPGRPPAPPRIPRQ